MKYFFGLKLLFEITIEQDDSVSQNPAVSAQTVIYLALFVCGPTVPHAGEVVQVWLVNVVAWEVLVKQGYQYYL